MEIVSPLLEAVRDRAIVDRWFFVRYGDPAWHVRLRFHGPREGLVSVLLPALHDRLAPLLATATLARVQLDTYEREVERYGGPDAVPLVEDIFHHDSQAALSIIELLEGDEGAEARWRLAFRGMHDLLGDFGLDTAARLAVVATLRARFGDEHRIDIKVERQLGERFRAERRSLGILLTASADGDHPLAPGIEALDSRSRAIAPVAAELRDLESRGLLATPREEIVGSLLHMHANRMLLAQHRAQEVVLYDMLKRHYTSELARARRSGGSVSG
jgi:thiopeptide-type bacteriocin biosynthesis protein